MPNTISSTGAVGSYGAITIQGSKNGYSGIEFKDSAGTYQGAVMMSSANTGFYNEATGQWGAHIDSNNNLTLNQNSTNFGRINPGWAVEGGVCTTGQIAKAMWTRNEGWSFGGRALNCINGYFEEISPVVKLFAMVRFNGNSCYFSGAYNFCSIYSAHNVSMVSRLSQGEYYITFYYPPTDSNYSVSITSGASTSGASNDVANIPRVDLMGTAGFGFRLGTINPSGYFTAYYDNGNVNVIVYK